MRALVIGLVALAELATGMTLVATHRDSRPRSVSAGPCTVRGDQLLHEVLDLCRAAVPEVTAVWGADWDRRAELVVVPDPDHLPASGDLADVAALVQGGRVYVSATALAELSPAGRRVVITHEITHLATGAARGRSVPAWLVEGFADYVGFRHVGIPVRQAAQELGQEVRSHRLPRALPAEAAFDGDDQSSVYEQSWLAVVLMVRTYGQPAVVRLYRAVAAGAPIERAMRLVLGTTPTALTRAWRADLVRELG